jgi:hypothetical protein
VPKLVSDDRRECLYVHAGKQRKLKSQKNGALPNRRFSFVMRALTSQVTSIRFGCGAPTHVATRRTNSKVYGSAVGASFLVS